MNTSLDLDGPFRLLVDLARRAHIDGLTSHTDPHRGDLVVEVTKMSTDADAIGWLVGHDDAPYRADDPLDGSVPMREVWDVVPLNPSAKLNERGCQRWENATFRAIPAQLVERCGLRPPELPE